MYNEFSKKEWIGRVKEHPNALRFAPKQTDAIVKAALNANPNVLCLVKEQTEDLCLYAIEHDPYALAYVRNQTERIVKKALSINVDTKYYVDQKLQYLVE